MAIEDPCLALGDPGDRLPPRRVGPEPAFIGSHIGNENFNGVIDELAFYNFALTAEEIALRPVKLS